MQSECEGVIKSYERMEVKRVRMLVQLKGVEKHERSVQA